MRRALWTCVSLLYLIMIAVATPRMFHLSTPPPASMRVSRGTGC